MSAAFKQFAHWFLIDPRHVWLCVVGLALACAVPMALGFTEKAIRITGLVLQLAGIVTVAWGIVSTRGFFGLPPVRRIVSTWWLRAPFRRRHTAVGVLNASSVLGGSAHGYSTAPIDPSSPVEQQLRAVERNLSLIHERITSAHSQALKEQQALRAELREQTSRIEDVRTKLTEHIKVFGTGGLHISAIGAAWLFLGAILGTASQELAARLQ
jgi:hypothetical protein